MTKATSKEHKTFIKKSNQIGLVILGLFVGIGLACCGFFISKTLYNSKIALNTAYVKGLAERRVFADTVNWTITLTVKGKEKSEIATLSSRAEDIQRNIAEILKNNGFDDKDISFGLMNHYYYEYRNEQQVVVDYYNTISTSIVISSNKVHNVEKARNSLNKYNVEKLIKEDVDLKEGYPSFLFTKLNEIKPEMLKEATKNARIAANEFAENAGAHVGSISNASQGSFQVVDAGMEYGDSQKIEKDVRVVTNITFYLRD